MQYGTNHHRCFSGQRDTSRERGLVVCFNFALCGICPFAVCLALSLVVEPSATCSPGDIFFRASTCGSVPLFRRNWGGDGTGSPECKTSRSVEERDDKAAQPWGRVVALSPGLPSSSYPALCEQSFGLTAASAGGLQGCVEPSVCRLPRPPVMTAGDSWGNFCGAPRVTGARLLLCVCSGQSSWLCSVSQVTLVMHLLL